MTSNKSATVRKKTAAKTGVAKRGDAATRKISAAKETLEAKKGDGVKPPRSVKKNTPVSRKAPAAKSRIAPPFDPGAWKDLSDDSKDEGFGFFCDDDDTTIVVTTASRIDVIEQGETVMASSVSDLEDEGFGFFSDDDTPAAQDSGADVIDLGVALTIRNVEQLHGQLEKLLGGSGSVRFEGGDLDQIDGSGLQLLCCFIESARVCDLSIDWGEKSTQLRQSAINFGASELLGFAPDKKAA